MIRTLPALLILAVLPLVTATHASASSGYNGATAAAYADTYWSNYNSAWPNFARKGGDCTNFVSQALYAGGLTMRTSPTYSGDAAWYMLANHNKWSWSNPWVNAEDNSILMLQNEPGVTKVADVYGIAPGQIVADGDAQPGDVVLYDWNNDGTFDHENMITASDGTKNTDGTINYDLADGHTTNRLHAYWTLAQYNSTWATTHIMVLHISPTA